MTREIRGVLPVMHTPFHDGQQVDCETLRREVDWAFDVGADGIVAAMVSEILRLSFDERIQLADDLVEFTADRGVVVSSVGAETTQQAVQLARRAEQSGCHAVMAIPPISSAASDSQLWSYFSAIADGVALPLIVQDASAYVGGALSLDFCGRLFDHFGAEKIFFKPEAAPIGPNLSLLRDRTDGKARIFDGSGGVFLVDAFRRGITGTIPGTDLLDAVVKLWRALQAGDESTAYAVYFPICAIVKLQMQAGLDGFLAIEKHLMVRRGIFLNESRRAPYAWELDAETRAEVDRLFDLLNSVV